MSQIKLFLVCVFILLIPACFAETADDNSSNHLRLVYSSSISSQTEGYVSVFQEKYPGIEVELVSKKNTTEIVTTLSQDPTYDLILVPDYMSLEKALIPSYMSWDIRYGNCAMVLMYSPESAYADMISTDNWYDVLDRENVTWAIVSPDADARGWRSLITIALADTYYEKPVFSSLIPVETNITFEDSDDGKIISAMNPKSSGNFLIVNNATSLVDYVKNGTIDYGWNYQGGAYEHNLPYLNVPEEIDHSSSRYQENYWSIPAVLTSGTRHSPPIVFTATIPDNALNPDNAALFLKTMCSEDGQNVLKNLGQVSMSPAEGFGKIPADLQSLVRNIS